MIIETDTESQQNTTRALSFNAKYKTRIASWNVRTLSESSRLEQLESEKSRYKIQILGICETRWKESGEIITHKGNYIIHCGTRSGGESGVALMIDNNIKRSLIEWKPISDRIITARFKTKFKNITIIQCYAPTEVKDDDEKDAFYEQLNVVLEEIPRSDIKVMMGDFNAKVGANQDRDLFKFVGPHGLGVRNENGQRLIDICIEHDLAIGGTLFPHKDIHKYTWQSPQGPSVRNQIDHICISCKWKKSLLDVRTWRGADINSDHILLTGDIRLRPVAVRNKFKARKHKVNLQKLKTENTKRELLNELDNMKNEPNTKYNIQVKLRQVSQTTLGRAIKERKEWISDNTWDLINQRRAAWQRYIAKPCFRLKNKYNAIEKKVKKATRRDKRKYFNNIANEAQMAANTNNTRELYRKINELAPKSISHKYPVKDKNGNILVNKIDQVHRWKEYFSETSNQQDDQLQANLQLSNRSTHISDLPPTCDEIKQTIEKLKNNKADGMDGVAAEILKADSTIMSEILCPIFEEIWLSEEIPPTWKEGIIIKLPKKGDLKECKNWRGITILNVLNKLLAQIIYERLDVYIDNNMREEQAGFRRGRGCIDQSNTLRIIVEQSLEFNTPLYIAFIDFLRAFDTIKHSAIWRALDNKGVPSKIIKLIQNLYSDANISVLHEDMLSEPFQLTTGVKQGCPLSPMLFNIVLDEIMRHVTRVPRGITWGFKRLEDLDYADDIALLAHSQSDLQSKIDALHGEAQDVGLLINTQKTKIMRINPSNNTPLTINGAQLEEVTIFNYLGSVVATKGGVEKDIENRLRLARVAFAKLKKIWRSPILARNTKIRIFNSCVISILLYGSETWCTRKFTSNRLQVFANRCLRTICKIHWPNVISNNELWELTSHIPIQTQILKRKWKWIGHTLRKPVTSIARQALEWNPQGYRRRGKPTSTWRRTVELDMQASGRTWSEIKELAQDRGNFRDFVEALCSQRE